MKFTIDRGGLLKALTHVQSVVERRNTIPILANVLLRADNGVVELAATDMDISVVEKVSAEVGHCLGHAARLILKCDHFMPAIFMIASAVSSAVLRSSPLSSSAFPSQCSTARIAVSLMILPAKLPVDWNGGHSSHLRLNCPFLPGLARPA